MNQDLLLVQELKKNIRGEVCTDQDTLSIHSRDTSLFRVLPSVVVYPKDVDDVRNAIRVVKTLQEQGENVSITGRSAGTDMTGGSLSQSVVLSFVRYMNQILTANEHEATAEPGVYYRDFEKETLAHGWLMPSYPASREICAIGGIVMNNSGGEKTLTYGKTEKYVKEIEMVLSNGDVATFGELSLPLLEEKKKLETLEGEIYRKMHDLISNNYDLIQNAKPHVTKNSAGYYLWNVYDKEKGTFDLSKVVVGSQGTLGIMTKATITGVAPKRFSRMLVAFLHDLAPVADVTTTLLSFAPETIESYDDQTFKVAMKFFPDIAKKLNGNLISLAFQFIPEFMMILTGGIPKLIIMAEFTGDDLVEVETRLRAAEDTMKKFDVKLRITKSEEESKKYWTFRRESFNLLRQRMHGHRTAPFIDDIVVNPNDLPAFLPRLQTLLKKYPLIYTIAGHVGNGNFHIIPLMDLSQDESIEIIKTLSEEVYDLVKEYKGSITGEHNDGIIRTPFLGKMFSPEILHLFEQTKSIFDPQNILNPGKKVHGSWEYVMAHIDRSQEDLEKRTYMPC